MNTDKAYILGLVIGGGVWGNAEMYLELDYHLNNGDHMK